MQQLEDGGPDPLVFVLNANLLSMVKIVNCKSQLFQVDSEYLLTTFMLLCYISASKQLFFVNGGQVLSRYCLSKFRKKCVGFFEEGEVGDT